MGMEQGDRNGRTTVKDHEAAPQTSSRGKLVKAGAQASEISGKALGRMIEAFMGLPGIGKKSAQRLAFAVLGMTKEEAAGIAQASEISGKALGRMIEAFMGLPGIGKKSAQRLAFAVLGMTKEEAAGIAQ